MTVRTKELEVGILHGQAVEDTNSKWRWRTLLPAFPVIVAGFAGWLGFRAEFQNLHDYGPVVGDAQQFIAAVFLLIAAWSFVTSRWVGLAVLAAWYIAALFDLPGNWLLFFGDYWGLGILPLVGITLSLPVLLCQSPKMLPWGLLLSVVAGGLTPLGAASPLLAATAFFPGTGWLGLIFSALLLAIPAIRNKDAALFALLAVCAIGTTLNVRTPSPQLPGKVSALTTFKGEYPSEISKWLEWQSETTRGVRKAMMDHGAALVVTPEGSVQPWGSGAIGFWEPTADMAKSLKALALVGVYRQQEGSQYMEDGLFDIATGGFYPAVMPMLVGMWHPWNPDRHYPINLSGARQTIKTPAGNAVWLICYEEMLIWPLTLRMGLADSPPALLVSAANLWFGSRQASIMQERSVRLQARLWSLPLLRAVNYRYAP